MRRQLCASVWFALVAALITALLPTLAHAVSHARAEGGGAWAEVCTPQGPQRIAMDGDGTWAGSVGDTSSNDGTLGAGHLQHCPLCALSLDARVLPTPESAAVAPLLSNDMAPAAFLQAPSRLYAWASVQPRGPPADFVRQAAD